MIAIAYHADLKEVQGDARLASLLAAGQRTAPFDRLSWWQGLVRFCGVQPLVAVAVDPDGVAILPLKQEDGRLGALSNWYNFSTRPLLDGPDAATGLRRIAADLRGRTARLTLSGLPDEDGSATAVEQAFRSSGWFVLREVCDCNHILRVEDRSFEEYLAGRPGPLRTTLKRKAGKVLTEVLSHFDADTWSEYEAIYRESWKPSEGSPDFLRAFAEEEGAAGRLRFGLARTPDGQAVAAQFWTVEAGTAFIHKLAHREEAKPISPGTTLSAALFRHVMEVDRVSLVDFGTGNDSYKRDWMEEVRPRYRLDILKVTSPRNLPVIVREMVRKLARKGKHG